MITTCQICGREIKANTGVIAHHGYRRRGGWQSGSCSGARHLPYEQSRDRIPREIELVNKFILNQQQVIEKLEKRDQDIIRFPRGSMKPETIAVGSPNFESWTLKKISNARAEIANAEYEKRRLQARYDKWIAPEGVTE